MTLQPEAITSKDIIDILWGFVIFDVVVVVGALYLIAAAVRKRDGDR